ncbi:MAG TPA: prepilin-type N-terminal cleavage/methylation domain-containing protein [Methylocella sp.]
MLEAMPFERPNEGLGASAGFTLIEALVALAVAFVSLAAIGSLMAGNIRGSGRIEQHLGLVETLRAVETEKLPDRASLSTGTLSGEMHGQAWSVDSAPFPSDFVNPRAPLWTPQLIVIKVLSPSEAVLQLATVRLVKRTGEP